MPLKLAVLVSGRGSNLKAILEAIQCGRLDASVEKVISNSAAAPALDLARSYAVEASAISHDGLKRIEHERLMLAELCQHQPDYIVLAGYMRILTGFFLGHFRGGDGFCRVTNIHPSLLPAFPGDSAYEDAFNWGVHVSGVTVHLVDESVDHGPILAQRSFARYPADTLEEFKARGLEVEHELYPETLQAIVRQGLRPIDGKRNRQLCNKSGMA